MAQLVDKVTNVTALDAKVTNVTALDAKVTNVTALVAKVTNVVALVATASNVVALVATATSVVAIPLALPIGPVNMVTKLGEKTALIIEKLHDEASYSLLMCNRLLI